ncbi:hypothetical protein P8625_06935 [Tenacibaculum tangerinum]|uniref:Bacteriocin n=1 Tax=Tenacibaculum tangerinum TaxID=3038772 RepID=A0ABY8L661_9FLAO|nr:hypothetical protein [Tenacibaculum tangerinum]WGH76871.1 hypothetical protein P8625_06935 [Tenacibaculum tangerinum]
MKNQIFNLGKVLNKKELKKIKGSVGFGEFGCNTDLDCDSYRLRCCHGVCLSFDSQYDAFCNIV